MASQPAEFCFQLEVGYFLRVYSIHHSLLLWGILLSICRLMVCFFVCLFIKQKHVTYKAYEIDHVLTDIISGISGLLPASSTSVSSFSGRGFFLYFPSFVLVLFFFFSCCPAVLF